MAPLNSREVLVETLSAEAPEHQVELSSAALEKFIRYYELLQTWNSRLHLVAPCSPEEFAKRHLLESLFMTKFISEGASGVDVGSGAGLPIIPCLIVRHDLKATLIESSQKKSVFLREALKQLELGQVATVTAERFEKTPKLTADFVSCRALDKFEIRLPELIKWARPATLLLFGGPSIREKLREMKIQFKEQSLPRSERRSLFIVSGQ